MKIKLAILDNDQSYLSRIVTSFGTKYADKLEIYSFTDAGMAMSTVDNARIDVLVASDAFEINVEALPDRCAFAYFVDSPDIDTERGQKTICKFQKADLIYKQILSVYSEKASSISGLRMDDDSTKIIVFASPCGGSGTSTMAAACAMHFASKGKKTFYLNLEKYGSSDLFFQGEGQFDMSDIIFALKSRKTNLALKLESSVKQDSIGVCYYSQAKIALDMLELNSEDMIRLISEMKLTGEYDYIVVDMDFGMSKDVLSVYRQAHSWIWVGDGSELSNSKIYRAYNALATLEANAESPLTNRLSLIYNKFSSKTSKALDGIELKNIGGAPKYEHAGENQILSQLSVMTFFDTIV